MNNHLLAATTASWKKENSPIHLPTEAAPMPKMKCYRENLREHLTGKKQEGCLPPVTLFLDNPLQWHWTENRKQTSWGVADTSGHGRSSASHPATNIGIQDNPRLQSKWTISSRAQLQCRRLWKSSVGLCQKETKLWHITNISLMFKKQIVK
jgi:hypothetical protein